LLRRSFAVNLFVVEDDVDIGSFLSRGLEAEGFNVTVMETAAAAIERTAAEVPSAILLDIMLPDGSGVDVCRELRSRGYRGPIICLSAKDEVRDRAEGLTAGADDYIVKPFVFDELVARLRTQLLRHAADAHEGDKIRAGRLVLDLTTRQVHYGDVHVRLTERESELLSIFMQRPNRPISRGELVERLWAGQGGVSQNVVDVYVGYLRGKLAGIARSGGPSITTIRSRGFMFDVSGTPPRA
jgi:DNA-binding response OmpR family regulator